MIGATAMLHLALLQLATLSICTNALQATHCSSRRGVRRRAGEDDSVPQPDPIYSDEAVVALCMNALGRNDDPIPDAGLRTCWNFSVSGCVESNSGRPTPSTRRASVAPSARWLGDSTPSTRRCPRDRNLIHWLISTQSRRTPKTRRPSTGSRKRATAS